MIFFDRNIIENGNEINVVPMKTNLDNIDEVVSIVKEVDKRINYNKTLTVKGYLINNNPSFELGSEKIKSISCPYRNKNREI